VFRKHGVAWKREVAPRRLVDHEERKLGVHWRTWRHSEHPATHCFHGALWGCAAHVVPLFLVGLGAARLANLLNRRVHHLCQDGPSSAVPTTAPEMVDAHLGCIAVAEVDESLSGVLLLSQDAPRDAVGEACLFENGLQHLLLAESRGQAFKRHSNWSLAVAG